MPTNKIDYLERTEIRSEELVKPTTDFSTKDILESMRYVGGNFDSTERGMNVALQAFGKGNAINEFRLAGLTDLVRFLGYDVDRGVLYGVKEEHKDGEWVGDLGYFVSVIGFPTMDIIQFSNGKSLYLLLEQEDAVSSGRAPDRPIIATEIDNNDFTGNKLKRNFRYPIPTILKREIQTEVKSVPYENFLGRVSQKLLEQYS